MKLNLNIGIVGFGSIGKKHYEIIKKNFKTTKVYIFSSKKIKKINFFNSFEKFLKNKLDIVMICSPANTHINYAKKILKKKINVFIEKPLSSKAINKKNYIFFKKNKKMIEIGYVFKHDLNAQYIKKIIEERKFGKIIYSKIVCKTFFPKWRKANYERTVTANRKLGGGALNEVSHEIHYANWFFGPFKEVKSNLINSKKLKIDVEDQVIANFYTKKNFTVDIHIDIGDKLFNKKDKRICTIIFEKSTIKWDLIEDCIYIYSHNKIGKFQKLKKNSRDKFINQMTNVISKIRGKKNYSNVTFDEAYEIDRLIKFVRLSSQLKKKIAIK